VVHDNFGFRYGGAYGIVCRPLRSCRHLMVRYGRRKEFSRHICFHS
jgi:hypothetical protein